MLKESKTGTRAGAGRLRWSCLTRICVIESEIFCYDYDAERDSIKKKKAKQYFARPAEGACTAEQQ